MYIYERYNFRMFPLLMALMTFIFLVHSEFIGASVSLVLGILLSFTYQGIKIDTEKQQYLKFDRFLRIKIGQWQPLSTPSYVTIVRINLSSKRSMPSPLVLPENTKRARSYKVNLVVEGDERYISICRGSLEKMIEEALRLGKHLDIQVLDYTTSEKKWIR
ncbi:MAG: hypothetical protein KAR19_06345 [Bacteroidales bacterium]|nr:hypothetical protein [Bacteroidales bacterium]